MISTIQPASTFLNITKVDGEYQILTNKADDELFIQRILYLLIYHADVFAAYFASTIFDTDDEKMMVINNFESEIEKYSIFAIEVEHTDEKHNWAHHNVKECFGDFSVGEGCTIAIYLGYVYLFKELEKDTDKVVISISKDYERFLDITSHDNKYYVMLNYQHNSDFISTIIDNLNKYGSVFAAYVKTINHKLPYPKKESQIYDFPNIVKSLDIRVINVNSDSDENNWKDVNVQEVYKNSLVASYGNYIYLFSHFIQSS